MREEPADVVLHLAAEKPVTYCSKGCARGQQDPTYDVQLSKLASTIASVTFTVTDVVLDGYIYVPEENHDPEGTSIVVTR